MDKLKELDDYIKAQIAEKEKEILTLQGEISGLYSALGKLNNMDVD